MTQDPSLESTTPAVRRPVPKREPLSWDAGRSFDRAFNLRCCGTDRLHVYCPGMPAEGCELRVRMEAVELQDRINGEVAAGATAYAALETQGLSHSQIVELVMVMSGVDPADVPGLC